MTPDTLLILMRENPVPFGNLGDSLTGCLHKDNKKNTLLATKKVKNIRGKAISATFTTLCKLCHFKVPGLSCN